MNIWIVEDVAANIDGVRDIVEAVFKDYPGGSVLTTNDSIVWPKGTRKDEYPDIVVLDIMYGETEPRGQVFYEELRRKEDPTKGALVIVWSGYTGNKQVEAFLKKESGCGRFFRVEKSEELLRLKLEGVREKLLEKREVR